VLVVAFLVDTAIAAVDAVTDVVLINLVVAGPLIAASRTGPRRTALIGGYALALGIYEGIPHHILGEPDHVVRCAAIALTGGLAVWGAWLRERREAAQRHTALLAEAGALLNASLDHEATLRNIARLVVPLLADRCRIDVVEPGGATRTVAALDAGAGDGHRHGREPGAAATPPGVAEVMRTGRPEVYGAVAEGLPATHRLDAEHAHALDALGVRAMAIVPMVARGRTLGAITLASADPRRPLDAAVFATAQELARRCAMALDNARLYGQRGHVAQTLQASLLPARIPEVPGFEVAARFHAGDDIEVGGDFFDVFEADDGWAAVIGDVSGKGAAAAAVTALLRYTARAVADRDARPSAVLRALNAAVLRQDLDDRFCTAAYAQLQPSRDGATVQVSSAGHPLPLLVRSDGRVAPVGEHGMLLGVAPDPPLADRQVDLEPGDKLVFFTDGVVEARVQEGILGVDGLIAVLGSCGDEDTVRTGEAIYRAAVEGRSAPDDDIAVLVLRAVGGDGARCGDEGLARSGAVGQVGALNLRLRGGPDAPSTARRALDALQVPLLGPEDAHRARLLVSEIVTNSVRHAGVRAPDWIGFEVELSPDALRVQVADRGPGFRPRPHPHRPPPDEVAGRGLFLVDRLADRWGTSDDGRCVWFELDRRGDGAGLNGADRPAAGASAGGPKG
jgi:serine phosphatase RsbU (regulator of sigma subunit)/anti-sigma regulatory factor (Ser/Thr protein kinase)